MRATNWRSRIRWYYQKNPFCRLKRKGVFKIRVALKIGCATLGTEIPARLWIPTATATLGVKSQAVKNNELHRYAFVSRVASHHHNAQSCSHESPTITSGVTFPCAISLRTIVPNICSPSNWLPPHTPIHLISTMRMPRESEKQVITTFTLRKRSYQGSTDKFQAIYSTPDKTNIW